MGVEGEEFSEVIGARAVIYNTQIPVIFTVSIKESY